MKEPKFHICHRWISFFLGPVTAVCNCSNMALVFIEQSFSQNFNIFDVLHVSKFCGCQFRFPVQVSASLWAQVFSASARVLVSYFVCTHSQSPKDMRPDRYRVRCTHMRNQLLVAHTQAWRTHITHVRVPQLAKTGFPLAEFLFLCLNAVK